MPLLNQAQPTVQNSSGASNADYQGILAQYANQQSNPYYSKWKADLDAGKLAGSPLWFLEKYAENKKGEEAIAKQAEIAKQLASYGAGQAQQGVQAGMTGAGLGKSGFMQEPLQDIAANEQFAFSDIMNRMQDLQQQNRQGLEDRWQGESFMKKAERAQKKNRKMSIASAGLGMASKFLGAV